MARDLQKRLQLSWPAARRVCRFDSRRALGRGDGREGSGSGGAQTIGRRVAGRGAGGERAGELHQRGGVPGGSAGARQPTGPAAASYRLGLLSAQQPGRPGLSRGTSRAASPGLRLRLHPGNAGEGAGAERAGAAAPGRP